MTALDVLDVVRGVGLELWLAVHRLERACDGSAEVQRPVGHARPAEGEHGGLLDLVRVRARARARARAEVRVRARAVVRVSSTRREKWTLTLTLTLLHREKWTTVKPRWARRVGSSK